MNDTNTLQTPDSGDHKSVDERIVVDVVQINISEKIRDLLDRRDELIRGYIGKGLKYPDARDAFREELRIAYYNSSEKIPFDIFKFYSNIRANFTQYFIQHEQKSMLREIFQSPFLEQLRETPEGKKLEKDLKAYYARYRDRLGSENAIICKKLYRAYSIIFDMTGGTNGEILR